MKKILGVLCLILSYAGTSFGQDKGVTGLTKADTNHFWHHTGITNINFNQVQLNNWQGGGQNTIAGSGFLHMNSNFDNGTHQWDNKIEAAFGMIRLGNAHQPFQKSDDYLQLASTYARDLNKQWSIALGAEFKTTFAPGYKYGKDATGNTVAVQRLSQFMSPGYLQLGAGIKYKYKDLIYAIFSPVAGKMTVISNDSMAKAGVYGVPAGRHIRVQAGEAFKVGMKIPVMQNVVLESTLDMFGNYKHVQQQAVDWTLSLTCKINSLLTANVGTELLYDQDIAVTRDNGTVGPAVQFKEVIAIGIQYKLY